MKLNRSKKDVIRNRKLSVFTSIFIASNVVALTYEVPPSTSGMYAPYISDVAMEKCVKLYNKAKWLSDEIDRAQVNDYSQISVNNYNDKILSHSQMIDGFNQNCAGKQSKSAYEAAKRLNNR
jgi:ubiquinone biosynthesis protein UbiJ